MTRPPCACSGRRLRNAVVACDTFRRTSRRRAPHRTMTAQTTNRHGGHLLLVACPSFARCVDRSIMVRKVRMDRGARGHHRQCVRRRTTRNIGSSNESVSVRGTEEQEGHQNGWTRQTPPPHQRTTDAIRLQSFSTLGRSGFPQLSRGDRRTLSTPRCCSSSLVRLQTLRRPGRRGQTRLQVCARPPPLLGPPRKLVCRAQSPPKH
jgi:hypothetical protein